MLKTAIKSTLRLSNNFKRFTPALNKQPHFTFSNNVEVFNNLKGAVDAQITHEEANLSDLSEFTNFFQNQGWAINYHGLQIELSKKNGPYDLRMIFNAKTPMPAEENDNQQEEMQEQNPDYTDIAVFIKKDTAAKWLMCEFMVTSDNDAHLGLATFIENYDGERAERAKSRAGPIGYAGPELSSLQEKFQESIYEFIEGVGVSGEILQRASEFSISYEHQFYVQWLKDFRSLV